jgi:CHAT domain-containing protein
VLEYVVADDRCYAILLTRNPAGKADLESWAIPLTAAAMQERVAEFRKKLGDRDAGFRKTATELYDLLVRPAAARLNTTTTLIIVPDRALWELPFQALHDGHAYMLESRTVLYAPSLAVVAAMQRTPQGPVSSARLFAVGNPASKSTPLPHAEREVHKIASLYGPHRSRTFLRQQASETAVKREMLQHAILHFATHGYRDNSNPMHSHVLLASPRSGEPEDGALEAREFMELELAARLVVLSACETAIGRVSGGEGMIGLTWALFIAGSPTTVASQWKVDSESTTDLMIAFHRNLNAAPGALNSSMAAAKALRRSALQLLRSPATAHPFYWAGFVTVGTRI